ncbi:hypothetical protein J7E81_29380 [Bacillus sp. ISL-18]|uniref:hypothetical protein n=1 Tax=Bacillus sp. ISL-18 TaxID=2819118 RepID=UPI001BE8F015|nr:hypothetical protein [Bacillus sp. ISL-18]MBT2659263.1 hypothetical protein [Bacillus sp. ISL-18]
MLKVLSQSAFALALAGCVAFSGVPTSGSSTKAAALKNTYELSLAHYVSASP